MLPHRNLGPALAWKVGEQWHYATREGDAPEDALQADLIELDGETVLCVNFGDSGVNVWGAVKADQ